MTKELCILHANCQGEPLLERLNLCPDFSRRYETRIFTNYIREAIPDQVLADCSLFLYQHLSPGWNDLASDHLLGKIPHTTRALCVPNLFFKGYWPTWSGAPGFDYRCEVLDKLLNLGLPPEETLILYLRRNLTDEYDLAAIAEESLKTERQRETHTPVKYVHLIESLWGHERLFNTVNHPGPLLMNHVANGVLHELGLPQVEPDAMQARGNPFPEFEQPIHPHVGAFFGWNFAKPDTRYNVYGRQLSFAGYAADYVTARKSGVTDFISFLLGCNKA
ncbi:WcbI family polysaccharide biosynthesis putative acetyltransferase [Pseudodesulfovibrio sp.]|uniref:WcbI family polysaccharide biosynthesis putative acetyltransferase n=1 Tax=unclassified Pseudodesulfovibrio TaxID=2661612 RepID=UPI003B006618